MRILVTGASGFVGTHLLQELRDSGHEAVTTAIHSSSLIEGIPSIVADLRDAQSIRNAVETFRPGGCIHLAAQAHVPTAWQKPAETMEININGTIHLLEAFREVQPSARILFISTADVYGRTHAASTLLTEDSPLRPTNLYAISKAAADEIARAYATHHGMSVMVARPQNHIGPGQSTAFVAASFAAQLIQLKQNPDLPQKMLVGNLDSERDFLDVRDVTRAYLRILLHGTPGLAYNIASGENRSIQSLLDTLCQNAGVHPERVIHEPYFRPTEIPPILDTTRIQNELGWKPALSFEQTVKDILAAVP